MALMGAGTVIVLDPFDCGEVIYFCSLSVE